MTSGGSGSLAFVKEDAFDSVPGAPTYYLPGRNPTVEELNLNRQLQRLRTPTNAEAVDSLAGNLDGAFSISYGMSSDTHDDVRDIVFNSGGTGFTTGLASTSSWYVGSQYLDSTDTLQTVERHLQACIPLEYVITYQQETNAIRETLNLGYADENRNTSFTPSNPTSPSDGSDVAFHGCTLTIDSTSMGSRLQSATLRIAGPIYRFHTGNSATKTSAVLANPTTTLTTTGIFETDDRLELAYGGATGTTSIQDRLSNVSGTLGFDVGGTTVADYSLSNMKATSTNWENVLNPESDFTESLTWHVNGGLSIST